MRRLTGLSLEAHYLMGQSGCFCQLEKQTETTEQANVETIGRKALNGSRKGDSAHCSLKSMYQSG